MSENSHLVQMIDPTGDTDPIEFIIEEHRFSAGLAKQFNETLNKKEKQNIAHMLIKRLSIHAACEEIVLFPIMRLKLPDGNAQIDEALAEHKLIKEELYEFDSMSVDDANFDAKFNRIMAMEIEHSDFEETSILPKIKAALTPTELKLLKEDYISSMKVANTRPHPAAPVEPPLVNLSNPVARVVDSIKDAFRFASSDKPQVE